MLSAPLQVLSWHAMDTVVRDSLAWCLVVLVPCSLLLRWMIDRRQWDVRP